MWEKRWQKIILGNCKITIDNFIFVCYTIITKQGRRNKNDFNDCWFYNWPWACCSGCLAL